MVYMACCPGIGKRAAQLLALAALCVAAFWFGLRDPPTNIGSGALRSRALLPHYNLDTFTYQINYAHPLRYYNLITLYYLPWSLSLRMPSSGDGATSTSSTTGMELLKDTYIPVFNNKPGDYREWRQRIGLYRRKLELQGKGKEAVLNVLTSLHGVAWRQLEPKWRRSWRRKRVPLTSFSMSWTQRSATTRMSRCLVPLKSSSMG
jgi:hypothetical protein